MTRPGDYRLTKQHPVDSYLQEWGNGRGRRRWALVIPLCCVVHGGNDDQGWELLTSGKKEVA